MSSVPVVLLVEHLPAGDPDLRGVDHDDVVASVDMRRKFGLVLAAQARGDLRGEAAEHLAVGVHQVPSMHDVPRLCCKGLHGKAAREKARILWDPRSSVKPLLEQKKSATRRLR
jgi:hypothetical protein